MSQAQTKPETFVNFRPEPEPDPKSPARLTTLLHPLFTGQVQKYV